MIRTPLSRLMHKSYKSKLVAVALDEDRVPFGWLGLFRDGVMVAQVKLDDVFDADGNRFDEES